MDMVNPFCTFDVSGLLANEEKICLLVVHYWLQYHHHCSTFGRGEEPSARPPTHSITGRVCTNFLMQYLSVLLQWPSHVSQSIRTLPRSILSCVPSSVQHADKWAQCSCMPTWQLIILQESAITPFRCHVNVPTRNKLYLFGSTTSLGVWRGIGLHRLPTPIEPPRT